MKIAFFDTKSYDREFFLRAIDGKDISIKFFETKLSPDTAALARGCDVACVFVNDTVNAVVIDALCALGVRAIALRCAGFNNVDLRYAKGRIAVFRVPAYSPYAVAEHAMAMLLTSVRKIHKAYNRTREFNFSLGGLTGFDLHGKTVGIIGTGKIGKAFASICRGFGMRVICYDKYPSNNANLTYVSLKTLISESDILSLHCPLTEETHHLINKKALALMRRGIVIINTSRGALIDAEALLDGIKNGQIGAACLDVYEEESNLFFEDYSEQIVKDDLLARLISMPNVLVTSHQAFLTSDALESIAFTTIQNVSDFLLLGSCKNEL